MSWKGHRKRGLGNLERNLEMREAPTVLISDRQYLCFLTYQVSSSKALFEELWNRWYFQTEVVSLGNFSACPVFIVIFCTKIPWT